MANGPTLSPENQRAINALQAARQRSGGGLPAGAPQIRGTRLPAPPPPVETIPAVSGNAFMPAGAQAVLQQIEQEGQRQIQELTSMEQAAQADMDRQMAEDRERYRRMYDTEMEQETRFLTEEQARERDERYRRRVDRSTPEGDRGDQEILQAQREKFREEFEPRHSGGRLVSTEVQDPRTRGERASALRAAAARRRDREGVTEEEEARDLGYAGVRDFLRGGPEDLDSVINQALGEAPANEEIDVLTGDLSRGSAGRARLGQLDAERARAAQIARRRRQGGGSSSARPAAPSSSQTPTRGVGPMRKGYAEAPRSDASEPGPMREGYVGAQGSSGAGQQAEGERRELSHGDRRRLRAAKVARNRGRAEVQGYVDERARRGPRTSRTGGSNLYEIFNTRIGSNVGDFIR